MGISDVDRRTVLAAALLPLLGGCGVRLEGDAGGPTPTVDPAVAVVGDERARVAAVLAASAGVASPVARALRGVHDAQLHRLDTLLADLGAPLGPTGAATSTSAAGTGTTAPTSASLAVLLRAESAGLDAASVAAQGTLDPRIAVVVGASLAQRAVGAGLLGGALPAGLSRTPWAVDATRAARLVDAVRSAAYGIEVAAAHLTAPTRATALDALTLLRDAESALVTGHPELPPRPPAYRLPRPVTTPAQATALLDGVLDRLVVTALDLLSPATSADDTTTTPGPPPATSPAAGSPTSTLLRLTAAAELARLRCGGTLRPLAPLRPGATPTRPPRTTSPTPTARGT